MDIKLRPLMSTFLLATNPEKRAKFATPEVKEAA
jgi:hypothetical protein